MFGLSRLKTYAFAATLIAAGWAGAASATTVSATCGDASRTFSLSSDDADALLPELLAFAARPRTKAEVGALFPRSDWIRLNHRVIWHGRRRCHARRPACGACPQARLCPSYGEGPTDPKVAATLVREPRG